MSDCERAPEPIALSIRFLFLLCIFLMLISFMWDVTFINSALLFITFQSLSQTIKNLLYNNKDQYRLERIPDS
jgi:hypothetical protein